MVHSCARFKQGEITQKSRCILRFGKLCISVPSELWQLVRFSRIWLKELRCLFYRSTDQVLAEHKKSKTWWATKKCWGGLVRLICTCMLKTWGMICWIYWDEDLQRHGLWTQDKWQFTETLRQGWVSFSIEAIWSFQLSRRVRRLTWKWQVGNIHCERNCWLILLHEFCLFLADFRPAAPSFAKSLPASEALNDPARLALRFPMATRFVATIACYFVATGAEDATVRCLCQRLDIVNGGRLKLKTKRCKFGYVSMHHLCNSSDAAYFNQV